MDVGPLSGGENGGSKGSFNCLRLEMARSGPRQPTWQGSSGGSRVPLATLARRREHREDPRPPWIAVRCHCPADMGIIYSGSLPHPWGTGEPHAPTSPAGPPAEACAEAPSPGGEGRALHTGATVWQAQAPSSPGPVTAGCHACPAAAAGPEGGGSSAHVCSTQPRSSSHQEQLEERKLKHRCSSLHLRHIAAAAAEREGLPALLRSNG